MILLVLTLELLVVVSGWVQGYRLAGRYICALPVLLVTSELQNIASALTLVVII